MMGTSSWNCTQRGKSLVNFPNSFLLNFKLPSVIFDRNFCCDCGNSKFPGKCTLTVVCFCPCSVSRSTLAQLCTFLFQNKASTNEKNSYNHNFKGVYCICNKPYPDPDDLNPDDMVQCVICEDWLHNKVK